MNRQEQLNRICKTRGLPKFPVGTRCEVDGKAGVIVGGNASSNLDIVFDGDDHASNCHPDWRFSAFDREGKAIYHSRS